MKSAIVFIFNNSWGEIDFILPVMRSLYKNRDYSLVSVFINKDLYDRKDDYTDLFNLMDKYCKAILTPRSTDRDIRGMLQHLKNNGFLNRAGLKNLIKVLLNKWFHMNYSINIDSKKVYFVEKIQSLFQVEYILCSDPQEHIALIKYFPKTRYILYPHAIYPRGSFMDEKRMYRYPNHHDVFIKKFSTLKNYPQGTVFLVCNPDEKHYFERYFPSNINIVPIGQTKHQSEWIIEIKKVNSHKNNKKKDSLHNILLLIGKDWYIGKDELENKIRSVLSIAEKYSLRVLYKPHPRTKFSLVNLVEEFDQVKISKVQNSVLTSALDVELVVSTSKSGACMDCIAVGTPVIEYYRYNNGIPENMLTEFKIDGKVTGLFRHFGMVVPIDDHDQFERFIDDIIIKPSKLSSIAKKQYLALQNINYNDGNVFNEVLKYVK